MDWIISNFASSVRRWDDSRVPDPAGMMAVSFASPRVTRGWEAILDEREKSLALRCDNGRQFTSRHFLAWCIERQSSWWTCIQGKRRVVQTICDCKTEEFWRRCSGPRKFWSPPVVAFFPGQPPPGLSFFRALRDSQVGSGQKEQPGEEALYWESSVFRYRRTVE